MTSIALSRETLDFAERALAHFAEHPEHMTFGAADPDTLFAVRWGITGSAVRVFTISPDYVCATYWK